jgi:hypothetical protein
MEDNTIYDSSWDSNNEELWDIKFEEWEGRNWTDWLTSNLTFPFEVERTEDDYFNPLVENSSTKKSFSVGHAMKVLELEMDDETYGIIVNVRESRRIGSVPLCDLEVTSKEDSNFWPVREYVVWFANREM